MDGARGGEEGGDVLAGRRRHVRSPGAADILGKGISFVFSLRGRIRVDVRARGD